MIEDEEVNWKEWTGVKNKIISLSLLPSLLLSGEESLDGRVESFNFFNHSSSHLPHFSLSLSYLLSLPQFSLSLISSLSLLPSSSFVITPFHLHLPLFRFCNHRFIIWNKKDFKWEERPSWKNKSSREDLRKKRNFRGKTFEARTFSLKKSN